MKGGVTTVFSCASDDNVICAAVEPRANPAGTHIAFSVVRPADNTKWPKLNGALPEDGYPWSFKGVESEIWMYEVATGAVWRVTDGYHDREVDWISDTKIVFTSDRAGTYPLLSEDALLSGGNYYPWKSQQPYTADLVDFQRLENVTNIGPHEVNALSPTVLESGPIVLSSWQGYFPKTYGTDQNFWPLAILNQDGTDYAAVAGWHGSGVIDILGLLGPEVIDHADRTTEFRGTRNITEMGDGTLGFTNYYRGNSGGGFGSIMSLRQLETGAEGARIEAQIPSYAYSSFQDGSGQWVPSSLLVRTPWAQDQDNPPRRHANGQIMGRAGYPTPALDLDGAWVYIKMDGWCYVQQTPYKTSPEYTGGEVSCGTTIMLAHQEVVTDPFNPAQNTPIACIDDTYLCRDVSVVAPRPSPRIQETVAVGEAEWQVWNLRMEASVPVPRHANTPEKRINFGGIAVDDYDQRAQTLCVDIVEHWDTQPPQRVPGWQSRDEYGCFEMEADHSIRVAMPEETPYLVRVLDADGEEVGSHVHAESLRKGEKRRCYGCHVGHGEFEIKTLPDLDTVWNASIAAQNPPQAPQQ